MIRLRQKLIAWLRNVLILIAIFGVGVFVGAILTAICSGPPGG